MACLHYFRHRGCKVSGLFIDYGQAAAQRESVAAGAIAHRLDVGLTVLSLSGMTFGAGEVRGRNAMLLTAAFVSLGDRAGILAIGVHAGTGYVDCSPAFIREMNRLFDLHSSGTVRIDAPFLRWKKAAIYGYAQQAQLPLDLTYSCETGSMPACGTCRTCQDIKVLRAG